LKVEPNLRKEYIRSDFKQPLNAGSTRLMAVGQLVGFSHEGKKIVGTGTMYGSEFYHENQDPMKVKKYVITSV